MKVREFRIPGQSDQSDRLALSDLIAGFDADTALGHMAVLGAPAVFVFENHQVAAFLPGYLGLSNGSHRDVSHSVSGADHAPGRGGQHFNARTLHAEVEKADVRAVVTIIGT